MKGIVSILGLGLLMVGFSTLCFAQTLPSETSTLFSGSGNCAQCHSAGQGVFTTQSGEDISPVTTWRSSMMANAARDPLWQAKVSAEVAENPALKSVIEDKCTTCHAPMGRTEAIYNGAEAFSIQEMLNDPLSMDGVSCTLCHQIQQENLGTAESFTGHYKITNVHEIYGPYASPATNAMQRQSGYTPVHSPHVNESEMCATCHTLYTPYLDNEGQIAGTLPEQTPYLEWQNSIFPDQNIECQTCHMPAVDEAMKISTRPPSLSTLRSPIFKHDFVGANVFMLTLLKDNSNEIGVTATQDHFGVSIAKARTMLEEQTIDLSLQAELSTDTLFLDVLVKNLSGHKFPTAYPSRRAWLHVVVKNSDNATVFESGAWDENGEIAGLDEEFEPHHTVIRYSDQVQIYQSIMQDVDGKVTYTLLRGSKYVKDNRIPPQGFTASHANYDDVKISGQAESDPDFNKDENGNEGTGADHVLYNIPVDPQTNQLTVTVEMCYQTVATRFAEDLFQHQTEQVATFKTYYDAADKNPLVIKTVQKTVTKTSVGSRPIAQPDEYRLLSNYPNPFNAQTIIQYTVKERGFVSLEIMNMIGRPVKTLIATTLQPGTYRTIWDGRDRAGNSMPSGIYIVNYKTQSATENIRLLLLR